MLFLFNSKIPLGTKKKWGLNFYLKLLGAIALSSPLSSAQKFWREVTSYDFVPAMRHSKSHRNQDLVHQHVPVTGHHQHLAYCNIIIFTLLIIILQNYIFLNMILQSINLLIVIFLFIYYYNIESIYPANEFSIVPLFLFQYQYTRH